METVKSKAFAEKITLRVIGAFDQIEDDSAVTKYFKSELGHRFIGWVVYRTILEIEHETGTDLSKIFFERR